MRSKALKLCPFWLSLELASGNVLAWQSSLDYHESRQSYKATELLNGKLFNEDSGKLDGKTLSLHLRPEKVASASAWELLGLGLSTTRQRGLVDYQGANQVGFPIFRRGDIDLQRKHINISYHLKASDAVRFAPYLGLDSTRWVRNIQELGLNAGLKETARSLDAVAGLSGALWVRNTYPATKFVIDAALTRGLRNTLVSETSSGFPDPATLKPEGKFGYRWRLGLESEVSAGFTLGTYYHASVWKLGSSPSVTSTFNGQPGGTTFFPGVTQRSSGWSLSASLNF